MVFGGWSVIPFRAILCYPPVYHAVRIPSCRPATEHTTRRLSPPRDHLPSPRVIDSTDSRCAYCCAYCCARPSVCSPFAACHANPCSLCWPILPFAACAGSLTGQYENIAFRNVHIFAPAMSPGVLLGSLALPMRGVTFHSVRVHSECGAASHLNSGGFTSAFPRLPTVVHPDHRVTAFYALVGCAVLLMATLAAGCCTRGSRRLGLRTGGALALVLVAMMAGRAAWLSPQLRDTSAYYMCEGVEQGVATGETWPVPPCFVDRTTRRGWGKGASPCVSTRDLVRFGGVSALAMAGAACLLNGRPLCGFPRERPGYRKV